MRQILICVETEHQLKTRVQLAILDVRLICCTVLVKTVQQNDY